MAAKLSVSGSRDQKIAAIAAAQRGRVSRTQLRAAGISSSAVARLAQRGSLLAIHRSVFGVGHTAPVPLGPETAALLAVPGAILSHRTAAALWGLMPPTHGDVHVLLAGTSRRSPAGIRIHRTRRLDARDVRRRDRLILTSPARTLLDNAADLTERQLELALDQGLVSHVVRRSEVVELLGRSSGRPGHALLAGLLKRQGGPTLTRSEAEERFLALIRAAELPEPEINVRISGYEVDFLWRAQKLVVEIDGFRFHSTRRAFEQDRRKDAVLSAAGLATMRVTWRQLVDEAYAVVARLAQALLGGVPDTRGRGPVSPSR